MKQLKMKQKKVGFLGMLLDTLAASLLESDYPKIRDGVYAVNLDEYESVGTHSIMLMVKKKCN